jgi:hypothetical protein
MTLKPRCCAQRSAYMADDKLVAALDAPDLDPGLLAPDSQHLAQLAARLGEQGPGGGQTGFGLDLQPHKPGGGFPYLSIKYSYYWQSAHPYPQVRPGLGVMLREGV